VLIHEMYGLVSIIKWIRSQQQYTPEIWAHPLLYLHELSSLKVRAEDEIRVQRFQVGRTHSKAKLIDCWCNISKVQVYKISLNYGEDTQMFVRPRRKGVLSLDLDEEITDFRVMHNGEDDYCLIMHQTVIGLVLVGKGLHNRGNLTVNGGAGNDKAVAVVRISTVRIDRLILCPGFRLFPDGELDLLMWPVDSD
jgi:hypothetical protein